MRVPHSCLYPEQIALGLTQINIINEYLTDEEREKQAESPEQAENLVSNKDKMETLPPGPVFLNLLPESGRGVHATQAEVSKNKDSWWQRRIKTGLSQDSFQISSMFRTYFFNNSSLWVVRQQLNNSHSQISLLYPDLQGRAMPHSS